MKIKVDGWKPFRIGDFFVIHPTKAYPNLSKEELNDGGDVPFVVNSSVNNGIGGFSSLKPTEEKGIITFSDTTDENTFFYQPHDFIGFAHVQGMYPKTRSWTKNQLLFLVAMLKYVNSGRYNYGRKMTRENISNTNVLFPVDNAGAPDWQWIENFIERLRCRTITTKNILQNQIDISKWQTFRFGDLIDNIYKAKAYAKIELESSNLPRAGYVRFVSRTEMRNGIDCYVMYDDTLQIEKGNALVIGDTTATITYQADPFATGDHIIIIRADWMNKYTGLFVASLLQNEKFRYSYGRAFLMDSIKNTSLKLPSKNGTPDWEFMESYIKSLPYGDRI